MKQPELQSIIPQIHELPKPFFLDNGVEMNLIPMAKTEIVVLSFMFKGGQWMQEKKLQSDFAMREIKSGTSHTASMVLADKLDYYGASIGAGNSLTHSFVQLTCLKRTLPYVLPLFCDILTSPSYEQPLLDIAIEEGMLTYQMSEQQVSEVSKRIFYKKLLGENHPASAFATEQDYQSISREDLLRFHSKFIGMANAALFVTGNVDSQLISLINAHIGNLPALCSPALPYEKAKITTTPEKMHETELAVPSVQSGLRVGTVMPDSTSEDYPAIMLTSTLLGGYFGSRLMKKIRERLGLTYGIHSAFYPIPYSNVFFITTETTRQNVSRCVEEIQKQMQELQSKPVEEDELKNARNFNLGQFCRVTETSMSLHHLLMSLRAQQRTLASILEDQQKALTLTPEEVMLCAQKYFSPENMLITAAHGKEPSDAF